MKKILIPIIILLVSTSLYAQDRNKVSGGLYVKGGSSWLMSDNKTYFANKGAKFTYGFGAIMNLNFTNNFAFDIAAGYSNIGGTANLRNGTISFTEIDGTTIGGPLVKDYKFSTSYIEVPISIKGCTNEIGYFTYFLKLGIDPMVRIKNRITLITDDSSEKYVATKQVNLFNLGWHVGGGFEWSLVGNTRLLVEVLYLGSFIDLDKLKTVKDDLSELNPKLNSTI